MVVKPGVRYPGPSVAYLIIIGVYSAAQIALGAWVARRVRGSSDFFVAGRASRTWSVVRDLPCRKYRRRLDDQRRGSRLSRRAGGVVVGGMPRPSGRPFWPSRSDRGSAASPPSTICGPSAIFSSGATTHASAARLRPCSGLARWRFSRDSSSDSPACSTRSSGFPSRSDA